MAGTIREPYWGRSMRIDGPEKEADLSSTVVKRILLRLEATVVSTPMKQGRVGKRSRKLSFICFQLRRW